MAEFVQIMKDWRRMCKAYSTDDGSCCAGCPIVDFHEHGCGAIFEMEDGTDWQRYAETIMSWAAEHPEPVYPTWEEWLGKQGVLDYRVEYNTVTNHIDRLLNSKAKKPIPTDIAQKLGIEPK